MMPNIGFFLQIPLQITRKLLLPLPPAATILYRTFKKDFTPLMPREFEKWQVSKK
jgi:hypothetical protein